MPAADDTVETSDLTICSNTGTGGRTPRFLWRFCGVWNLEVGYPAEIGQSSDVTEVQ
jgi:hypothetical protein